MAGCVLSTTAPASRLGKDVSEHGEEGVTKGSERSISLHSVLTLSLCPFTTPSTLTTLSHVCQCVHLDPVLLQPCIVGVIEGDMGLSWRERGQVNAAFLEGNHQLGMPMLGCIFSAAMQGSSGTWLPSSYLLPLQGHSSTDLCLSALPGFSCSGMGVEQGRMWFNMC